MSKTKVGIILPSRGMIFARVIEEIEKTRQLPEFDIRLYIIAGLPIPDAPNLLINKAMDEGAEYLWFVEEDTVPPQDALPNLLKGFEAEPNVGVTCIDYAMHNNYSTVCRRTEMGEILFCGFGMTLVKREIFERMQRPYLRSDQLYNMGTNQWYEADPMKVYGHHDIYFGAQIRKMGYRIYQIPGECEHLKLVSMGSPQINNGCHIIEPKGHVMYRYFVNSGIEI